MNEISLHSRYLHVVRSDALTRLAFAAPDNASLPPPSVISQLRKALEDVHKVEACHALIIDSVESTLSGFARPKNSLRGDRSDYSQANKVYHDTIIAIAELQPVSIALIDSEDTQPRSSVLEACDLLIAVDRTDRRNPKLKWAVARHGVSKQELADFSDKFASFEADLTAMIVSSA